MASGTGSGRARLIVPPFLKERIVDVSAGWVVGSAELSWLNLNLRKGPQTPQAPPHPHPQPQGGGGGVGGVRQRRTGTNTKQKFNFVSFWAFWAFGNGEIGFLAKNYVELTIRNRFWWIWGRFCRYGVGARSPLLEESLQVSPILAQLVLH